MATYMANMLYATTHHAPSHTPFPLGCHFTSVLLPSSARNSSAPTPTHTPKCSTSSSSLLICFLQLFALFGSLYAAHPASFSSSPPHARAHSYFASALFDFILPRLLFCYIFFCVLFSGLFLYSVVCSVFGVY